MKRSHSIVFVVLALVCGSIVATPGAAVATERSDIPGSHPTWATPESLTRDVPDAETLSLRVYLNMRNQAKAESLAQAVSSPGNARFREYLSPEQVRTQFAPTERSTDNVEQWLASAGFRVGHIPVNNLYVEARGTVAQVEKTLDVEVGVYEIDGTDLRSIDRDMSVPRRLSNTISGVVGIDAQLNMPGGVVHGSAAAGAAPPQRPSDDVSPGVRNAEPCSDYWGEELDTKDPKYGNSAKALPYAPCGYEPPQLRDAYGLSRLTEAGVDGRGTTIAIVGAYASNTIYEDAAEYAKRHDPEHPLRREQFRQIKMPAAHPDDPPAPCTPGNWYREQTLDVEAVHAIAPGANIIHVAATDCQDTSLDKALNEVVSKNLAQIVSNSFYDIGENIPPADVRAFDMISLQAVLQGIGMYFCSGDTGDNEAVLGSPSANFFPSSPWVTAVGGTSVGIDEKGKRVVETGWQTGSSRLDNGKWTPDFPGKYQYGSGGGTSRIYAQPFYQRGVVPDELARRNQNGENKGRVMPDISMIGNPDTGMRIGQTQQFADGVYYDEYRYGGTSLSTPLFAGYVAVADQIKGIRHGFVNPSLYKIGTGGSIKDVTHTDDALVRVDYLNHVDDADGFHVAARTLDYPGLSIRTTKGYDAVTGLGTPTGATLLFRL